MSGWAALPFMLAAFSFIVTATPARAEAYLAGYIGGARTKAATVVLEQSDSVVRLNFENVPFSGKAFQSPIYYGYRAGYYFTRNFGIEGEFIHLKIYADLDQPVEIRGTLRGNDVREQAPMSRYADQFEVSHGLNMVVVNAVLRRSLVGSREPAKATIALVARAGAGPTIPRPEVIVFGAAGGAYEAGPVAFQAAAGVTLRLWRGLAVLTEYKYTFTPTAFTIPNGRASLDVHSHHVVTGFAVHF
jgi:opacity protein-like surface antigen